MRSGKREWKPVGYIEEKPKRVNIVVRHEHVLVGHKRKAKPKLERVKKLGRLLVKIQKRFL